MNEHTKHPDYPKPLTPTFGRGGQEMVRKTRAYLAGPMRGHRYYNFDAFDAAREVLSDRGYSVISPADLDRAAGFHPEHDEFTAELLPKAVRRDVDTILYVDVLFVLPDFENSTGVRAEIALALWLGKPVFHYTRTGELTEIKMNAYYESVNQPKQ